MNLVTRSSIRLILATVAVVACSLTSTAVGTTAPAGAQSNPTSAGEGWVRLGQFAPGGGPVDVLIDGVAASPSVTAGTVSPYLRVSSGTHQIQAVPSGSPGSPPLVGVQIAVPAAGAVTVGVVTTRDGIGAQVYDDSSTPTPAGKALVRFIHTVPDVPVDIAVNGGPVLASNVTYPNATPYGEVDPGTYDLQVRQSGSTAVLLKIVGWTIAPGAKATVVLHRTDSGSLSVAALLDAGGTATMPLGGASTGMGGAAPPAGPGTGSLIPAVAATLLLGAALGLIVWRARHPAAGSRRPLWRAASMVALSLALVGLAACAPSGTSDGSAASPAATTGPRAAGVEPGALDRTADATPPPAPTDVPVVSGANVNTVAVGDPVAIRIPSLDVRSDLIPLGLADDGTIEVPPTAQQAGWFTGSPAPGSPGAAVILGHVDSHTGPGVFHRLQELDPGAEVLVDSSAGVLSFVVSHVQQVPKDEFPSDAVYQSVPEPALRLVTCGGTFDHQSGHYRDNIVVYLTPEVP